jgi:hypothetical protein
MYMFNIHTGRHYYRTSNPLQLILLTHKKTHARAHTHTHTHTQRATSTQHIRQIVCKGHIAAVSRAPHELETHLHTRVLETPPCPPAGPRIPCCGGGGGGAPLLLLLLSAIPAAIPACSVRAAPAAPAAPRVLPAAASAGISNVRACRAAASP